MQRPLSTSSARRAAVVRIAVIRFAERGLRTTIADIAAEVGISPAYVFKLFPRKEALFAAAIEAVDSEILRTLGEGARRAADQSPAAVLAAMRHAYAGLLDRPELLRLLVHAQAAIDVPEVGVAYRHGVASLTEFVLSRSGASEHAVQEFIAFAQLHQLIANLGIVRSNEHWTRILTSGIRFPASA